MLNSDQFKQRSQELLGLLGMQKGISYKANMGDNFFLESLDKEINQLQDDTFKVLVIGEFTCGKSTLLNALMGKPLLPDGVPPTTGTICEIVYSDVAQAVLYPKDERQSKLTIKTEELAKYICIDHTISKEDREKKPNPYRKAIVKYPLNICKQGIVLVDSPGLSDPSCHDAITEKYISQADAIIYCISATQPYTKEDKQAIERLTSLGYKSIIFVVTKIDLVQYNDMINGTNEVGKVKDYCLDKLSKHTDLGKDGIFFVSSLLALNGKTQHKPEMLARSNFLPLEKRLEEILFAEKGRMRLLKTLYAMRRINRETTSHLMNKIDVLNTNKSKLKERIDKAQKDLDAAQSKADKISLQFETDSYRLVNGTKDRGRAFFLSDILPNISTWVEEFEPSDEQSISMFHPKRTGTAFTEGCIKYVQARMETRVAEWCQDLVGNYLVPQLKNLAEQQDANLRDYEDDLKHIRATLNLHSLDGDEIRKGESAGTMNRISAALLGILLNPAAVAVGGAFGWKGLITSLVTTLIGGIVIGIIAIFTPVGWPALIITWIVSALVSGKITGNNIESKIKKKIAEKMYEELSKQQENVASQIEQSVMFVISKAQTAVKQSLRSPVVQYEKVLAEAKESEGMDASALQRQIATYKQLQQENMGLANETDTLAQKLGA